MNMKKKILALIVMILLVVVLCAGCDSGANSQGGDPTYKSVNESDVMFDTIKTNYYNILTGYNYKSERYYYAGLQQFKTLEKGVINEPRIYADFSISFKEAFTLEKIGLDLSADELFYVRVIMYHSTGIGATYNRKEIYKNVFMMDPDEGIKIDFELPEKIDFQKANAFDAIGFGSIHITFIFLDSNHPEGAQVIDLTNQGVDAIKDEGEIKRYLFSVNKLEFGGKQEIKGA